MKAYKVNGMGGGYIDFVTKGTETVGFVVDRAFNPYLKAYEKFGLFWVNDEKGEDKIIEKDFRFTNGVIQVFDGFFGAPQVINPLDLTPQQVVLIENAIKADPECKALMVKNLMAIAADRTGGTVEASNKEEKTDKKKKTETGGTAPPPAQ